VSKIEKKLNDLFRGLFDYWRNPDSFRDEVIEPNEAELKLILDPKNTIFSVIISHSNNLKSSAFENPDVFQKKEEIVIPILDQEVVRDSWNNSHTRENNKRLEKEVWIRFKIKPSSKVYGDKLDIINEEEFEKKKKLKYPEVLEEYTSYYISETKKFKSLKKKLEFLSDESPEKESELIRYFLTKNPNIKEMIHKKITEDQVEYRYFRDYSKQLPKNLYDHLPTERLTTQQVYVCKSGNSLKIATGSSSGSGTRESHGYFGHLFAEAQNRGKKIETFIVHFDQNVKMKMTLVPELVLSSPHDLIGNYGIDRKLSSKILKNIKKINSFP
jgi:hypothetical protein